MAFEIAHDAKSIRSSYFIRIAIRCDERLSTFKRVFFFLLPITEMFALSFISIVSCRGCVHKSYKNRTNWGKENLERKNTQAV